MIRHALTTDADREARVRARLAQVLALLADEPDNAKLQVLARRLEGVVACYDHLRLGRRLSLLASTWSRRN